MSTFALRIDDELDLVLREHWTVGPLHRLVLANIDRLRQWEIWAAGEQTEAALDAYTQHALRDWVSGRNVPTAIRWRGELVGTIGARIDPYYGNAELGYWVDAASEGHGMVTRAAQALIRHLFVERGVQRVEIRCAVGNARSRAVADRLGMAHEGTLRWSLPVAGARHDTVVYGLPRPQWTEARV